MRHRDLSFRLTRKDVYEYRDLIGRDFETYITAIQAYFRCLEDERARAFEEAREVSEEYGRFCRSRGSKCGILSDLLIRETLILGILSLSGFDC